MDAFPAFFALKGRTVTVAGEGAQADAKARLFEQSPAHLVRLTQSQALEAGAFDGALLAFIAGDEAFCKAAADQARAAGALVNVVDRPALSDFNTPALIDRGEVVVGIGTAGAAPMMAALLRNDLEARIPEGAGRVAALFKRLQEEVRAAYPDLDQRREFLRQAFASPAADAAAAGDSAMAERLLRDALREPKALRRGRISVLPGEGPVELLSLRAARVLGEADVVVVDEGADPAIVALARRDAERFDDTLAAERLVEIAGDRRLVVVAVGDYVRLVSALRDLGVQPDLLQVIGAV
jgi:precorrin-2 dehydrogenase/sirohydrochlorin ferrochelatase